MTERKTRSTKKWVRNLRQMEVGFRLKESNDRIDLKPRGYRGDMTPLNRAQLNDPQVERNEGLLFEIITDSEAQKILEKQHINAQKAKHPALNTLRNSKDLPMEDVSLELSNEEQAILVAQLKEEGRQIHIQRSEPEVAQEQDEAARRKDVEGPEAGLGGLKVVKGDVEKE